MNTLLQKTQEIYWKLLGQKPMLFGKSQVIDTGIPSPWMNGVLPTELQEYEVAECVEKVAEHFRQKQLPFSWWSQVDQEPKNLKETLNKQGLTICETLPGLILNLDEMKEVVKPQDLQVQVVSTRESLQGFVDVLIRSYGAPTEASEIIESFFLNAGLNLPILHFLAKEAKLGVAAGSLFLYEGEAFVYHVATILEKRKKGISSFLMYTMLKYAQYHGCKTSFLTSTSMALNMYLQLGYKRQLDFHLYL